ncbi:MAG: class I SAM-dependent methyltransferase [Dehalococcoidales bacterium]|nr:class I SAM-dependent methyltransferase [Dehalococcoidales bacterium]
MDSLINWEALRQLGMPAPTPRQGGPPQQEDPGERWGKSADMYNRIARMEKSYTLNQLNAFDTDETDTVLDIGCGPGRISVPMAQRAKSVTSLDASDLMLEHCRNNAKEAGVTNLKAVKMNWEDAELGKNLEQHDIVIASRSPGMQDIQKTCTFARKYVVVIAWANTPNVPTVVGDLFRGIEEADGFAPMRQTDRRLGYNITYNMIYDMGYDPNVNIVTDGFTMDYSSREEAYADLWQLRPTATDTIPEQFRKNVNRWLTENPDGSITFRRETRSFVIWWRPSLPDLW